jgi:hypothetical protein
MKRSSRMMGKETRLNWLISRSASVGDMCAFIIMSKCVRGSWARAPRGCIKLSYMSWTEYPSGGGESDRSETIFIFMKGRVSCMRLTEFGKAIGRGQSQEAGPTF